MKFSVSSKQILDLLAKNDLVIQSNTAHSLVATGISSHSQKLKKNEVFIAYKGVHNDLHQYIDQELIEKSAILIVEQTNELIESKASFIQVKNSRKAWAIIASAGYSDPQKSLTTFGVTGTNGKTSTCYYLAELLQTNGAFPIFIGTLGARLHGKKETRNIPTHHTTPDPDALYRIIAEGVELGCDCLVMEVASHAMVQQKLSPIRFDYLGFTSFSRDHLDFHKTEGEYLKAKLSFFYQNIKNSSRSYIHENVAPLFVKNSFYDTEKISGTVTLYGNKCATHIQTSQNKSNEIIFSSKQTNSGSQLTWTKPYKQKLELPFFADFCCENFVCAWSMAQNYFDKKDLSVPATLQVPGRMEWVQTKASAKCPRVFVDFAHTPDALEKAILELKSYSQKQNTKSKVHVVFGCGGDRDQGKRPLMGKVCDELADFSYITSDNPRSENPMLIISHIIAGMKNSQKITVIPERKSAIERAISNAKTADFVLIAGKGHEQTQEINGTRIPFSDQETAKNALNLLPFKEV